MGLSKVLAQYDDVAQVLNAVVAAKSQATYTLPTASAAVRWRQRAYYFRKLVQEDALNHKTVYDSIIMRLDGPNVIISHEVPVTGTLTIGGQVTPMGDAPKADVLPISQDELRAAADRLGLEVEDDEGWR